jgi:hypothetical protein
MVESTPLPPPSPPDAPRTTINAPESGRLQNRWALFTATVVIAGAGAGVIGTILGFAAGASSASSCSPNDGWCGLGAALAGLVAGFASGLVAYVTTSVIMTVRCRPRGRRAGHILAALAAPPALVLLLAFLGTLTDALR